MKKRHGRLDVEPPPQYREYFGTIRANPDVFPGFLHADLAGNVLPKLELLRQFGFYPRIEGKPGGSCGGHSPNRCPEDLATRNALTTGPTSPLKKSA